MEWKRKVHEEHDTTLIETYSYERVEGRLTEALAEKLAQIPLTLLMSMKLIVNQAYDNMGLQSTQTLGPILDGIMRNTPEGREFVRFAKD